MRFHCSLNLPYLNSVTKEAENVSLKLNESYLNIPSVSTEKNLKIKRTDTIKPRPLKIGKLGENSQLWHRKYTYLNNSKSDWEIKVEK